jgi:hypothetical protein
MVERVKLRTKQGLVVTAVVPKVAKKSQPATMGTVFLGSAATSSGNINANSNNNTAGVGVSAGVDRGEISSSLSASRRATSNSPLRTRHIREGI